jgi:hypothetical protein
MHHSLIDGWEGISSARKSNLPSDPMHMCVNDRHRSQVVPYPSTCELSRSGHILALVPVRLPENNCTKSRMELGREQRGYSVCKCLLEQ